VHGAWYDVLFSVCVLLPALVAVRQWWRARIEPPLAGFLWFALIALVPTIGPLAFLLTSRLWSASSAEPS